MNTVPIIESIVDQHYDEASFLWEQRDHATRSPAHTPGDLARLDERLEAHIDGLRVAGDPGWQRCEAGLATDWPGTVFVAAVLAFESDDQERHELVIEAGAESNSAFRGLVSALGWLPAPRFNALIKDMVKAQSRKVRRTGLAACGIRRVDPRHYLDKALQSGDARVRARALKTAGQLKRADLLPVIRQAIGDDDHECRFEAASSALLLGDQAGIGELQDFIRAGSTYRDKAMNLVFRVLDPNASRALLAELAKNPLRQRDALVGAGIAGDPQYVDTLLKHLSVPALARAAAFGYSMITGTDLVESGLDTEAPEDFESGPNDDPDDDNVEMDPDDRLPWPDAAGIAAHWSGIKAHFTPGQRYLCGDPVTPENCHRMLDSGLQVTRRAAALELALSGAENPLINISKASHQSG